MRGGSVLAFIRGCFVHPSLPAAKDAPPLGLHRFDRNKPGAIGFILVGHERALLHRGE